MEVSPEIAKECMSNFETIMQGDDLQKINAAYSTSVSFGTVQLAAWLNDNQYLSRSVEMKLCFGIYTENAAKVLNQPGYVGRLTAFVWPVKANRQDDVAEISPIPEPNFAPFNTGELLP